MAGERNPVVHKLILENRQEGCITGVQEVQSFDEKEILLLTENGKLQIKGDGLHVKTLNLEKGEVELEGRIDMFLYQSKELKKNTESLIKRLFQ